MRTLANSEHPDEMQHNAAVHQGLHFLLMSKQFSVTEIYHDLENSDIMIYLWPLKIYNGQSYHFCFYIHGRIHQNT